MAPDFLLHQFSGRFGEEASVLVNVDGRRFRAHERHVVERGEENAAVEGV